jgi:uncharacterized coiled-coil protein SlyX
VRSYYYLKEERERGENTPMPSRLEKQICYSQGGRSYLFFDKEHGEYGSKDFKPDSWEYFSWLAGLRSFHFEGKAGRFTARLETRQNKDGTTRHYWSAYRKANKKQFRKYLGVTEKLRIAILEDTARYLTDVCTSHTPKIKTPRKRPEKREVLYARIRAREQEVARREKTIEELQSQIEERDRTIAEQKARIYRLEAALKTKRETLEL